MEIQYIILIFCLQFALILSNPVKVEESEVKDTKAVKSEEANIENKVKDAVEKKDESEEKLTSLEKALSSTADGTDGTDEKEIVAKMEAELKANEEDSDEDPDADIMDKIINLNEIVRAGGASDKKESDILETEQQRQIIAHHGKDFQGDLVKNTRFRWTEKDSNGNTLIPYVIQANSGRGGVKTAVDAAIAHYKEKTPCIHFVPRTNQNNYINFFSGRGCYSYVGMVGGKQDISLQDPGCTIMGIAVHEMMHALGYYHEQSRSDRDKFVTINFAAIRKGVEYNFNKRTDTDDQGTKYDYGSVMHYGAYAFAKTRGVATIISKDPSKKLGQRNGLSELDIVSLKKAYKCSADPTPGPGPGPTPNPGPSTGFTVTTCTRCRAAGLCNACEINKACRKISCKNSARYASKCPGWSKKFCLVRRFAKFMVTYCAGSCGDKYCA